MCLLKENKHAMLRFIGASSWLFLIYTIVLCAATCVIKTNNKAMQVVRFDCIFA